MSVRRGKSKDLLLSACGLQPLRRLQGCLNASRRRLEAGETVWRDTGLSADVVADILIGAMGLRCGQVVKLSAEKVFALKTGCIDIAITHL